METIPNIAGIEILTPTGFEPFAALAVTEPRQGLAISFEDGRTVTCTEDHLFQSGGKPVLAVTLGPGDTVDSSGSRAVVKSVSTVTDMSFHGPLHVRGHVYTAAGGLEHHNCQFVGSSTTLVSPDVMDKLSFVDPVQYKYGYSFAIYETPQPGAFYMLGVDSAAGSGLDYSCIQVLRIHSRNKYEQVATYADSSVSPSKFARIVKDIADWYNNAMAIVENNEIGRTVADEAWYTLGYDRILNTDAKGIGTRATRTSKLDACLALKEFLESGYLQLHDRATIHELTIFEEVSPNVFQAPRGKHDDRVSSLYWACYGILQPQVDLDNLQATRRAPEETPQTFWGDSDDDAIGWF